MEEQKVSLTDSFQKAKEYIETQFELLKLKAIARSARMAGAMVLDMTKLLLCLIIVFFLSLALGFFLGELLHSNALGFLTTALIFIVILFIVIAKEPKLEAKFTDLAIKRVMVKWNEIDDLIDADDKVNAAESAADMSTERVKVENIFEKSANRDEKANQ